MHLNFKLISQLCLRQICNATSKKKKTTRKRNILTYKKTLKKARWYYNSSTGFTWTFYFPILKNVAYSKK